MTVNNRLGEMERLRLVACNFNVKCVLYSTYVVYDGFVEALICITLHSKFQI